MKFFGKYINVPLIVFMLSGIALPYCQAQAQPRLDILNLFTGSVYLGVQIEDVTDDNMSAYKLKEQRGAIIRSVEKGSPAEQAKLQENDVLLEFAGYPVRSTSQLSRLVQETPPGREVKLVISRDGKQMNLTARLRSRQESDREGGAGMDSGRRYFYRPGSRLFQFEWPDVPAIISEPRPRLGVTLQPLTDQLGEFFGVPGKKGALVSSVISGTPSDGKLKSGDVIIEADSRSVENPEDMIRFIREEAGSSITLKVIRDKKEISVKIGLPDDKDGRDEEGFKL